MPKPKKSAEPKKIGRKSTYTDELADQICKLIADGESILSISKIPGMPDNSTMYDWLNRHSEFADKYARARVVRSENMAHEIVAISEELPIRQIPDPDGGVSECVDAAGVQRNKLRVDTRKWLMSHWAPKKYGDKVQAEISGKDGGPLNWTIEVLGQGAKKEEE